MTPGRLLLATIGVIGVGSVLQLRRRKKASPYAAYLEAAEEVARGAGRMIRKAHEQRVVGGVAGLESKGSEATETVDIVTATDKACEKYIIDTLRTRFPGHAFIGEESSFTGPSGATQEGPLKLAPTPTWIIDPLDGTTNFVHGYPLVTVAVALAVDGEPVVGVVYNPLMDELCSAARGSGCFLNGQRVHVGTAPGVTVRAPADHRMPRAPALCQRVSPGSGNFARSCLPQSALICNNIGSSRNADVNKKACDRLYALMQARVRGLRNSGSACQNMMHVACGRLDSFFEDGFGGPWDVAAGKVLVEEAGGVCRHPLGDPFVLMAGKGRVLCGNQAVVDDIARVLRLAEGSPVGPPE